jgi:undecaprenyl-diphosphatase
MSSHLIKEFIEECSAFGSLPFFLFLIFLFFILGEIQLSTWLVLGLILSFALVILIKLFYFKQRPQKKDYHNIIEKLDASTFPSLHSMRIVLILVFLSYYYKSVYLVFLLGIIACIVFYSRKYLKKHYWMDILFGALFGFVMSFFIIRIA